MSFSETIRLDYTIERENRPAGYKIRRINYLKHIYSYMHKNVTLINIYLLPDPVPQSMGNHHIE